MIARLLRTALWTIALGSCALFVVISGSRLLYPLELDCIEGVMMDHALRLVTHQPLYVAPSLHFVPLAYMPLFNVAAAALIRLLGPMLWVPRLVSLGSTWILTALIAAAIRRETGSRPLALGGAALYLIGFAFTGSCYDVARPDALMLVFVVGGLLTLRHTVGVWGALGAAALLTLGFFTKQHAALFALGAIAHTAVNDRRRLLPFGLAVVVGCVGGYALLSRQLGPWFSFYTWDVPSHWSSFSPNRVLQYVGNALVGTLGVLFVAWLLSLGLAAKPWLGRSGVWTWMGFAAIASGLLATLDPYAYRHTLMPTMMALAILGPVSLHRLAMQAVALKADANLAVGVICGILALQFLPLLYPFHTRLPHPRADEARQRFVARLQREPHDVMVPYHGFYDWSAGKPTSLHIIALDDVMRARGNRLLRDDPQYFDRMFEPLRTGPDRPALVTDVRLDRADEFASGRLWRSLASSYTLTGELGWITDALRPVTGNDFAPRYVYEPNRSAAGAPRHARAGAGDPGTPVATTGGNP